MSIRSSADPLRSARAATAIVAAWAAGHAATPRAHAEEPAPTPAPAAHPSDAGNSLFAEGAVGGNWQFAGTVFVGDGLRFNNPYRLQTQLSSSARTVSLTVPYVDLGLMGTYGHGAGFGHGAALRASFALGGVPQAVLAPTYVLRYRGLDNRMYAYGRIGPSILLMPQANVGFELAVGSALLATAKLGIVAEIVGNLYYGAATPNVGYPVYPILSLQAGLLLDHEVLP